MSHTSKPVSQSTLTTLSFTVLALIAFAANSVFCRLALGAQTIDAAGFTVIRLLSGAVVLYIILKSGSKSRRNKSAVAGSWIASLLLFLYAITFSYAYLTLDTGTGALVLFGSVQITMIFVSLIKGSRLHVSEWLGVVLAFTGFVYLVLPNASTPSVSGFILMTIAGISWGMYTLKGRESVNPLIDTAYNFLRTVPMVLLVLIFTVFNMHYSAEGILLAVLSGVIASGIGYSIWYKALAGLAATQAAVVQLLVPVIAAIGGVVFVAEPITLRLTLSGLMILGGILLVVAGRYYLSQRKIAKS